MFFKQLKHYGDNFSYVIADENSGEAAIVDPSFNSEMIVRLLEGFGYRLKFIINTHWHRDHASDNGKLKAKLGGKIVAHVVSRVDKDVSVADGDVIEVGKVRIEVMHTPGHSPDSVCLLVDGKVLTGDTLFVGECGRTDLPGGSSKDLYRSLFGKLMRLSDDVEVYPGHDYGAMPNSKIGLERKTNYTLEGRSLEEFVEFMKEA